MNRLLQHFVDSNGGQSAPASRPPIPAPPQSSGGSYHGGNRGSYQRAAPGGPFYYQPPPQTPQWQQSEGPTGLEEIPLTSQSGGVYETVDLNADSQQGQSYYNSSTTPGKTQFYPQTPGSTASASELFANGPPPAKELFGAPPSGGNGNPYRRQSNPPSGNVTMTKDPFAAPPAIGATMFGSSVLKDPFASPMQNGGDMFGQAPQNDPFATSHSENRNVFGNGATGASVHDPFAAQPPKDTGFRQGQGQMQHPPQQQQTQHPPQQQQQPADLFASALSHSSSPFDSLAPSNGGLASADSLFASPAPSNGDWSHPPQSSQPPAQAHELFASDAPSASSLFGGDAPSPFQMNHSTPPKPQANASHTPPKPQGIVSPSPGKSQDSVPSPAQFPADAPPSPMKPPVAPPSPMINASSPPKPQVAVPASPVMRPEDHLIPAFGSMKLSTPAKSPLKSGLDVRNMKFPTGKRDDDAISNAPSIAPSRMSMLSTLDDSLKLSDMYKQMAARLEGEKHDLLKVVASQAQEIAQMKKHIMSLELQLKKYRPQDA